MVADPASQVAPPHIDVKTRAAELRSVLQAPREREVQRKEPVPEAAPGNRRLSEQERVDLRQQLRQQHRTGQPDRH